MTDIKIKKKEACPKKVSFEDIESGDYFLGDGSGHIYVKINSESCCDLTEGSIKGSIMKGCLVIPVNKVEINYQL
ncbi:hypothetical protein [Salinivibrio phage CW02]|uniref:Uncharacterized protein n=1 Tax=Salinivibrio phage CW02 TaxID=1161935 RepID=H9D1I8_9CAUD|nr:hypothetical protein F490_gp07 [Salinivibrio phage CW02]AFE86230.1 hypothetical protein [Salinivibrio phage CW02]